MLVILGSGILFICLIVLKCKDINEKDNDKDNVKEVNFSSNYIRYKTYSDVV